MNLIHHLAIALFAFGTFGSALNAADTPAKKPNIVVIWGDDIGN